MKEIILRISSPYFCAGVVFKKDKVDNEWKCTDAAPIVRYMIGWDNIKIKEYCNNKKWKYERVS